MWFVQRENFICKAWLLQMYAWRESVCATLTISEPLSPFGVNGRFNPHYCHETTQTRAGITSLFSKEQYKIALHNVGEERATTAQPVTHSIVLLICHSTLSPGHCVTVSLGLPWPPQIAALRNAAVYASIVTSFMESREKETASSSVCHHQSTCTTALELELLLMTAVHRSATRVYSTKRDGEWGLAGSPRDLAPPLPPASCRRKAPCCCPSFAPWPPRRRKAIKYQCSLVEGVAPHTDCCTISPLPFVVCHCPCRCNTVA